MSNLYFVISDEKYFLFEDGKFYPAFEKSAYAVEEEVAQHYKSLGCTLEYLQPSKWPHLYGIKEPLDGPEQEQKYERKRRTYVRCTVFTLAAALDRLYDNENVRNLILSMEDNDFVVSFEYLRDYERAQESQQSCCSDKES